MRIRVTTMVLLALVACSRDPKPAAAGAASATPSAGSVAPVNDSVAAVAQGPGNAAVSMRFVVEEKPAVGKLSRLRLDFAAETPQQLTLRVEGANVTLDPAGAQGTVALTDKGITVSHSLSFTPQAPGLTDLFVHVSTAGGAPETVYAVPLLVDAAAP